MRWLLLAAAAVVAALLVFLLTEDDERTERQETRTHDVPESKEDYWRKRGEDGGENGAEDTSEKKPPRPGDVRFIEGDNRNIEYHQFRHDVAVEVVYDDGTPAQGATISAAFLPVLSSESKTVGTTDKDGLAKLKLPSSIVWLLAKRGSLAGGPERVVIQGKSRIKLVLRGDLFVIRGTVLGTDGRPALRDLLVSVNYWDGWEWRFQQGRVDGGRFECLPVPRAWIERMHIYVTHVGTPRNLFQWDEPVTDLTLRLTAETVRGRVVHPDGRPAPNMQVTTSGQAVMTDKDGRFAVSFQKRDGAMLRVRKQIHFVEADDREIEIVLKPGKPLLGRLVSHDGHPEEGAWVNLSMPVGGALASAGTDVNGHFEFLALGEGPHNLRFRLRGYPMPDWFVTDVYATDKLLKIVLPKPIAAKVRMRRSDGRAAVAVKHGTLIVRREGVELLKRTWSPSVAKKEFEFLVWEAGSYDLQLTTAFHEPAVLRPVRISEADVNVFDFLLTKRKHVR